MQNNNVPLITKEKFIVVEDTELGVLFSHKHSVKKDVDMLKYHCHNYFELFVCLRGSIVILTQGENITLYSGDIAIVPFGFYHYKESTEEEAEWFTIAFHLKKKASSRKINLNLFEKLSSVFCGNNIRIFRNMPKICERLDYLSELNLQNSTFFYTLHFIDILSEICELGLEVLDNHEQVISQTFDTDIDRLITLEQIISKEYLSDINDHTIAKALHVSDRQSSRIIKKHYGKTLREVIIQKRLEHAAYLLTDTSMSIEEIYQNSRFNNASHFYKRFREKYNITPSKYRELYQKT